jgi:hypothetical protein
METSKLVSPDLIAAYNAIKPKTFPIKVLVYVESYEDISFWRNILHEYEKDGMKFDIQTPARKGKEQAIKSRDELISLPSGTYLIICIDSDYDFLIQGKTPQSKLINERKFIFQTYSYSIENLKCFSESLRPLCGQATKHDKEFVDFNLLLRDYSNIIYDLFIWSVYFRMNDDHQTFTISDFCAVVNLRDKVDVSDHCSEALNHLQNRVRIKLAALEKDNPIAIKEIREIMEALEKLGVSRDNTYLFMHGHTLKENVVLKMLRHACSLMVNEKYKEIKSNALHNEQAENDRNQYENQKLRIESVLDLNTEFKNCFLYQKIKEDFDKYILEFR